MKCNDDASPAAVTNESVHQAAVVGVSGAGHAVPFAVDIQRSFGDHDISHIQAHSDAAALAGSKAMGAGAFASGNKIVLGDKQDKHTVAHEVAHVMQQRAGVQLLGGVGAVGKDGTVDFAAPSVNVFTCSLEPTFGTTKAVITHKANKAIALPQVVFSITSPALCTPITLEAALPMPPLKPPPLGF